MANTTQEPASAAAATRLKSERWMYGDAHGDCDHLPVRGAAQPRALDLHEAGWAPPIAYWRPRTRARCVVLGCHGREPCGFDAVDVRAGGHELPPGVGYREDSVRGVGSTVPLPFELASARLTVQLAAGAGEHRSGTRGSGLETLDRPRWSDDGS